MISPYEVKDITIKAQVKRRGISPDMLNTPPVMEAIADLIVEAAREGSTHVEIPLINSSTQVTSLHEYEESEGTAVFKRIQALLKLNNYKSRVQITNMGEMPAPPMCLRIDW